MQHTKCSVCSNHFAVKIKHASFLKSENHWLGAVRPAMCTRPAQPSEIGFSRYPAESERTNWIDHALAPGSKIFKCMSLHYTVLSAVKPGNKCQ